ncbi:uncharacterized protein [Asterias amurensis]|uniref:uncharacterized protein isoform X1 n=1 Tax=Asterias amurensis TaxID=7602 RepID=UPI003AB295FA
MASPSGGNLYREVIEDGQVRVDNSQSSFGSLSQVDDAVRDLLLHPNEIGRCRENPLTHKGKRIQLAKMLLLIIIPIISLAVLAGIDLHGIAFNNRLNVEVRNVIRFSRDIGVLLSCLQRERDMVALFVSAISPEQDSFVTATYPQTDEALDELRDWPVKTYIVEELPFFRQKEDFKGYLSQHRHNLHRSNTTAYKEIDFYTDVLQIFIDWLYDSVGNSNGHGLWQTLVSYQLLIVSNVDIGIARTLGSIFFARGGFSSFNDYVWYLAKNDVGTWNFEASKKYSPLINSLYDEFQTTMDANFTSTIDDLRQEILDNAVDGLEPNFEAATRWFDSMTVYINILESMQKKMANQILQRLESDLDNDTSSIAVSICLVVIVIVTCPLILRAFWSLTTDIQNYALNLASQTKALNKQRKKSNWLLYSLLPKTVAAELMLKRSVKPSFYEYVTLLFCDLVGFGRICTQSTPNEVVEMVNGLYIVFDSCIENYDVYNAETLGGTFMLASGIPNRNGDKHVAEIASVSLDIVHHISLLEVPHKPQSGFRVRIGFHTGPVVAGVVGLDIPRYCIFGKTVTMASRMQSTGLSSRIQVSDASYMALLELGGFYLMKRKDTVSHSSFPQTYWLVSRDDFKTKQLTPEFRGGYHELKYMYEHMYAQSYTGRIQYRQGRLDKHTKPWLTEY